MVTSFTFQITDFFSSLKLEHVGTFASYLVNNKWGEMKALWLKTFSVSMAATQAYDNYECIYFLHWGLALSLWVRIFWAKQWDSFPHPQSKNIKWVGYIWYMIHVIWLNDIFRLGPLMRKVLGWWQKPSSSIITYDEKASSDGLRGLGLLFMDSLRAKWKLEHEAVIRRALRIECGFWFDPFEL